MTGVTISRGECIFCFSPNHQPLWILIWWGHSKHSSIGFTQMQSSTQETGRLMNSWFDVFEPFTTLSSMCISVENRQWGEAAPPFLL